MKSTGNKGNTYPLLMLRAADAEGTCQQDDG